MISVKVKEDKKAIDYDYVVASLTDLDELMKRIYKPIIGTYKVAVNLTEVIDVKHILYNDNLYKHLELDILLMESVYKFITLAMPDLVTSEEKSMLDYLKDGISKRNLLIKKNVVYMIYSSVGKSYEEIDDVLDVLFNVYGSYVYITESDLSKHLVINDTVYPRTVLLLYINLNRYRKSKLQKCLKDISPDIVLASMIKQVKKLHEQKLKYLNTGLGPKFIKELNTKNLNLMYYTLVVNKPYHLNDIVVLLEVYERGLQLK